MQLSSSKIHLGGGCSTTLHWMKASRSDFKLSVRVLSPPQPLVEWCLAHGKQYALTGGFFSRTLRKPLGSLWVDGQAQPSAPWGGEWEARRGAIRIAAGNCAIAPVGTFGRHPTGDLLTAGPILVRDGASLISDDYHFEGITQTWRGELDADWTSLRAQRSAIGLGPDSILAVVCDGQPVDLPPNKAEAGLTLGELATILADLGAVDALNLDGGGGTSLVFGGRLVNRPRAGSREPGWLPGQPLPRGRALRSALVFTPRERG